MIEDTVSRRLEMLRNNLPLFCETCLKVKTIDGKLAPLIFNESQIRLHKFIEQQLKETGMVRVIVVKGRKQGVSTYTAARYFWKALFNPYKEVFILSHHSSTTKVLFDIVSGFYSHLPTPLKLKLKTDNSKQLKFENDSQYTVATAGEGEIGRGGTPHLFHGSEVASWENADALETGVLESVADAEGTEMILESTAKGIGNLFHRYSMDALEQRSLYKMFFLPWYIHEANILKAPLDFKLTVEEVEEQSKYNLTPEQLYWRRMKMNKSRSPWKFKQEFPATVQEAFQTSGETFFNSELIFKARKSKLTDISKPLIIGVDPARQGDRTVLAFRQGRVFTEIQTYMDMDEMRLVGMLAKIMNTQHPAQVFIDTAHGYGVIDRLRELGYGRLITGVNFGEGPSEPDVFANKRSEMYCLLRDWFKDGGTSIPDNDDMEMDLLAIPDYKEDSANRIILEKKDKIRKNYGKSPDIADAMALTFAYPVRSNNIDKNGDLLYTGKKKVASHFSSPIMESFQRSPQKKKNPDLFHRF